MSDHHEIVFSTENLGGVDAAKEWEELIKSALAANLVSNFRQADS